MTDVWFQPRWIPFNSERPASVADRVRFLKAVYPFAGPCGGRSRAARRDPGGIWRRHPDSNRGIRVLQTLALPLGYAAIHMSANGLAVRRFFAGYSAGYRFQAHHLSLD